MDVILYTDGSARGNPNGPGGYGAVLQFIDANGQLHEREYSQGYIKTTNNRMELMAAIVGLEALIKPADALAQGLASHNVAIGQPSCAEALQKCLLVLARERK